MDQKKLDEALRLGFIVPYNSSTKAIRKSKCGKYLLTMSGWTQWVKEEILRRGII